MFYDIDFKKDKSLYIQIGDYIKDIILRGLLRKNEKLPSTRELSRILKVSRNTIISAYEYLEYEGFVYVIKGKGVFVKHINIKSEKSCNINWKSKISNYAKYAEKFDIMKHEILSKKGIISFKSIAPDNKLFDIEEFKRAFLTRMSLEGNKILSYGYAQGYKPLIEYLMEYMKNKGVNVKDKSILITNGFTEGFNIVLTCLTKKGDKILCENPTHNTAIKIMKLHQINIIGIDMEHDGMNINILRDKLRKNKIKLSYLIPSYHNPTGIVMSPEKRVKVYDILKEYEVPIIEDGFNEELRYSSDHIAPISALCGEGNNIIYIGSFSKVLFSGLRIGWILADKDLINYMVSIKRSENIHTSFLDQAVFYQYLKEGNFEKYIKKIRKFYREKYDFVMKCIKKYIPHKKILGEGGSYIFIELKEGIEARKVLKDCYSEGVIFTPGDIFYVDNKGKNTLRIGFSKIDNFEIEKGLKVIGDIVKRYY